MADEKVKHVADEMKGDMFSYLGPYGKDLKGGAKVLEKVSCSDIHGEKYASQVPEETVSIDYGPAKEKKEGY